MLIHWIWLATRPDVSDRQKLAVLDAFGDPEDIFYGDNTRFANVEGMTQAAAEALMDKNLTQAQEILDDCVEKDIHIYTFHDAAYPVRLKNIVDPPVVLYYKGRLPDFDGFPMIGVVGTRKASAYGMTTAKRMGYQIATCGGVVVSGLASGIDGMAMRGALTAGVPVVGVLGNGVDVIYPASNRSLFADVEHNGCLLSEFPPETPPYKQNFPRRNRIISGLSNGVLIVEAPEKSGALITARDAADQGRDVFVVPGNIDVDSCIGSNALLRDGAIAVSSGWDVVSEYKHLYPGKIRNSGSKSIQTAYPDEVMKSAADAEKELPKVAQKQKMPRKMGEEKPFGKKKEIDNGKVTPYIDAEAPLPELTKPEEKVVEIIRQGVTLVDDIMAKAEMNAGSVLAVLTMLEIKGVIKRLPGKRVEMK